MENFLNSYRKEVQKAKNNGQTEEQAADKIPHTLLCLFLGWALNGDKVLIWIWSILQWHLMGHSIWIDPLSLHNIRLGVDHIIIKNDSKKSDQGGDKLIDKHCSTNPKDPQCCLNTSLGIWLCLNQERFEHSELIFRNRGTKDGNASANYYNQLTELLQQHSREVMA